MPESPAPRRWVTPAEAALELRCSVKTVRRRIADGTLYAQRFGPRLIRVDLASVPGRPLTIARGDR